MDWLFERMIELAALVAFVLGVIFLIDAGYLLVLAVMSWADDEPIVERLLQSAQAASAFVLSTLTMGALACIDRYVFDAPQPRK
jgi:hypothetical protein